MKFIIDILNIRNSILIQPQFDKIPTFPIILFEILIILFTLFTLFVLLKGEKKLFLRFFVVAIGIFIFEFFTSTMWNNYKMGWWAYTYQDVSWILTFGWASLILVTIVFVDRFFGQLSEGKRFGMYLGILAFFVIILESVVVNLGIRSYSPETQEVVIGYFLFGTPIGVLYYVPVFMALVIGFYKYWSFMIFEKPVMPLIKRRWLRSLCISIIGVLLFEVMVEPMVVNVNLPRWSYIYRDVSFLMTGGWIIITWLSINFVDKYFIHFDLFKKFLCYLCAIFIITLPIESWLMNNGFRLYSASLTKG